MAWILDPESGQYYDPEGRHTLDESTGGWAPADWRDTLPDMGGGPPLGTPQSDESRYIDLYRQGLQSSKDDRLQTRTDTREYRQAEIQHWQRVLDQSLMLAREAQAAHREEWKAILEERAEAARRELERAKRMDYASTTGFTYALPGEPALPSVTYNANYKPVAPLPPSRFAAPTGIMSNLARG